jgi:hypothetical protein
MKRLYYVLRQTGNDVREFSLTVYEVENNTPHLIYSDYINRGDEGVSVVAKREIEANFGECISIQLH